jgi:HEAT repeat protein
VTIFDFLRGGGKKDSAAPPAPVGDKKIAGHAKVVADKRAQTYDRLEAIQALAQMKSGEAAAALLPRFKFSIDPSITDQEEKELCFQAIVDAGGDVVPMVVDFCEKEANLTWPLKVLRELLDDDDYQREIVALLGRFDTEYQRNVEPKVQVIQALEEVVAPEVREAIEPFLEDVNETVRFHAVQTTFAQNDAKSVPSLVKLVIAEESVRIKNKVCEQLQFRGWVIDEELRASLQPALLDTNGFVIGAGGKMDKRGGY